MIKHIPNISWFIICFTFFVLITISCDNKKKIDIISKELPKAISYSNPYYVIFYFDNASIRINAYSIDEFSQKAVVDGLIGTIEFKGTSPVKLDHKIMQ